MPMRNVEATVTCGVAGHDEDCLCDVRVSSHEVPIRMTNLVADLKYGEDICRLRNYTEPWDRDQIVNFLEDILKAHDTIREGFYMHRNGTLIPRKQTSLSRGLLQDEQRDELRNIIMKGASYKDVMQHALDNWGIEVSKSYAAHLRKRTLTNKKKAS